jgi:hypothetical protein
VRQGPLIEGARPDAQRHPVPKVRDPETGILALLNDLTHRILKRAGVYRYSRRFTSQSLDQLGRFERQVRKVPELYSWLQRGWDSGSVDPGWRKLHDGIAQRLLRGPSVGILRQRPLYGSIYTERAGRATAYELRSVLHQCHEYGLNPASLLREDVAGLPRLLDTEFGASSMTVQHAFHLMMLWQSTGVDPRSLSSVTEWGGGYGGLARIVRRLAPDGTYVIFDLPAMLAIQWAFLTSIFGEEQVEVSDATTAPLVQGRINLKLAKAPPESQVCSGLFVSTFGLSECSSNLQEAVARTLWPAAEHILVAYQSKNPSYQAWTTTEELAIRYQARVVGMVHRPGSFYAVR